MSFLATQMYRCERQSVCFNECLERVKHYWPEICGDSLNSLVLSITKRFVDVQDKLEGAIYFKIDSSSEYLQSTVVMSQMSYRSEQVCLPLIRAL